MYDGLLCKLNPFLQLHHLLLYTTKTFFVLRPYRHRVGQDHRRVPVVLSVHELERLLLRAEGEGECLGEPREGDLGAEEVGEEIDRLLLARRQGRREALRDVVETVRDGHVLGDVAGVEDVGSGDGDGHGDGVFGVVEGGRELHLVAVPESVTLKFSVKVSGLSV